MAADVWLARGGLLDIDDNNPRNIPHLNIRPLFYQGLEQSAEAWKQLVTS